MVTLAIDGGRQDKLRPGDLLGARDQQERLLQPRHAAIVIDM